MSEDIRGQIARIIAEQAMVEPDVITETTTMEELGLDSLALVEVVFGIEEAFDVSIPFNANDPTASEFELTDFNSIVTAVQGLIAQKAET